MTKAALIRFAVLTFFVGAVSVAEAKPPFLKVFMSTYKIKEDSAIGKARCLNCHEPPGPPTRNPYGHAVQTEMFKENSRMVTEDILHAIEKKDVGDGVSYLTKIMKDVSPANPMPKTPPKPPVKKPVKKPTKSKPKAKKKHALFFPDPANAGQLMLCLIPLGFVATRKRG